MLNEQFACFLAYKQQKTLTVSQCFLLLVRGRRFELPSPCGRYHLKVVRLPISPSGQHYHGANIKNPSTLSKGFSCGQEYFVRRHSQNFPTRTRDFLKVEDLAIRSPGTFPPRSARTEKSFKSSRKRNPVGHFAK